MKKVILVALFTAFMLSAMVVPVMSSAKVGVAVYDFFLYNFAVEQTTSNASFTEVPSVVRDYLVWNDTVSVMRTVTSVSGTNVTFEVQTKYRNSSVKSTSEVEDVAAPSVFYPVIAADLGVNDTIRAGGYYVNKTVWLPYAYGSRETCVMNYTQLGYYDRVNFEYYWDRDTGVLVEAKVTGKIVQGGDAATTTFTTSLVDTNVIPEFSGGAAMLFVFVVVTVCVGVYGRRRLKRRFG